ncbi:MAG: hypothetical protein RL748_3178 [Pseudomonadota bacterium]|jgi:hypothetical protein
MMTTRVFGAVLLCLALPAIAGESTITAITRSNAENYQDRALAYCVATAYKGSPAGADAHISMSAFLEWTDFDDKGNKALDQLVEKYLRRDYSNPMEGYADAKFNLLKCIDMYRSRELAELVRKYVPHPDWIGDKPAKRKRK